MAGADYKIDPDLLRVITWHESKFNIKAKNNSNRNGSYDIGLMQINSIHLKRFSNMGISELQLMNDPCLNIYSGAFILAEFFYYNGVNWDSVGAYNAGLSKNKKLAREIYSDKIKKTYFHYKKNGVLK